MEAYNRRKQTRLQGYDYSANGYYFITACAQNRDCVFGEIRGGEMELNEYGKAVWACWRDLPNHYKYAGLDEFVVMPNHIHGIIIINNAVGNGLIVNNVVGNGLKINDAFGNGLNTNNTVGKGLKPFPTQTYELI